MQLPDFHLEEMESLGGRKAFLFEQLEELGRQQKNLARQVRDVERSQRSALAEVEEYIAPEPLTHEEVERWANSVYFSFARTMPGIPHTYAARKRCDSEMFERVAAYVQQNGYPQAYGGKEYTVYDVTIHGVSSFVWTMGEPPEETTILNCKPASLRPEEE